MTKTLTAAALALALAGCATESKKPEQHYSGFLKDYSALQPAKDREGVMLYTKPGSYRSYTKVMLEPVEVWPAQGAYQGTDPATLKRMSDSFAASAFKALQPDYQIVLQPGPDVLRIRSAITGVEITKPDLGVTDFIPIKAIYNVARDASGNQPKVAEMTGEIEVLDGSGTRIAAAVATRKGDKNLAQGDKVTWENLQSITDYWAKGLRQRLDEMRR
jgi:hypothetical protein